MSPWRAVLGAALPLFGACTLLAPSDQDLMGGSSAGGRDGSSGADGASSGQVGGDSSSGNVPGDGSTTPDTSANDGATSGSTSAWIHH